MNLYAASPDSLWSSPAFVRFMAYSSVAHVAVLALVAYGPIFSFRSDMLPEPVLVSVMDAAPEVQQPEPEPEPEPPPPAEVKPPEPEPAPEPEPPPPEQVVEEAVVIPDVPSEKPKPPKPPKQPEAKPKPPKPADVADVMKTIRENVEASRPPRPTSGAPGTVDPELAEYYRTVKVCLYQNWVGAQRFQRRRDLAVQFEVQLGPGGKVKSAEVTRASGENFLDESAERAILKCQPWPEPPGGRTTIPITFVPGEIE